MLLADCSLMSIPANSLQLAVKPYLDNPIVLQFVHIVHKDKGTHRRALQRSTTPKVKCAVVGKWARLCWPTIAGACLFYRLVYRKEAFDFSADPNSRWRQIHVCPDKKDANGNMVRVKAKNMHDGYRATYNKVGVPQNGEATGIARQVRMDQMYKAADSGAFTTAAVERALIQHARQGMDASINATTERHYLINFDYEVGKYAAYWELDEPFGTSREQQLTHPLPAGYDARTALPWIAGALLDGEARARHNEPMANQYSWRL